MEAEGVSTFVNVFLPRPLIFLGELQAIKERSEMSRLRSMPGYLHKKSYFMGRNLAVYA